MAEILPQTFCGRDVLTVARELVGKHLRRGKVELRITEVEAYRWPGDTACHARSGRTARNAPIWGPPGHAYVYLCYGIHNMLNIVTGPDGEAQAVLVRACEPVSGLAAIKERRGHKDGPVLLSGPGKVGQALELDTSWSNHPLHRRTGLTLRDGPAPVGLLVGPRVGIDYAQKAHRELPWRFAAADTDWLTEPKSLRALL